MARFTFERLVSRGVVNFTSSQLDLAGVSISVNRYLGISIIGFFAIFLAVPVVGFVAFGIAQYSLIILGLIVAAVYEVMIYLFLEFRIERRKSFVESILPDYLQLVAADMRSGISLDRALLLAKRPEFGYFSQDIDLLNKQLYSGETMQNALNNLSRRYRSVQLRHTIRMILEAVRYGGALADLLNQIAKDMRARQIVQKEIAGQLFMYTIFITFAAVIAAPALYGLTLQMITITDKVWAGILAQNPGGLPTVGISFLKPSAPQVSPSAYYYFAIAAITMITGFGSLIVATITSGSPVRGLKYLPVFIIAGIVIFLVVAAVMGNIFSSIGAA